MEYFTRRQFDRDGDVDTDKKEQTEEREVRSGNERWLKRSQPRRPGAQERGERGQVGDGTRDKASGFAGVVA
jgi:hypothetical protein